MYIKIKSSSTSHLQIIKFNLQKVIFHILYLLRIANKLMYLINKLML